jgi:dTDP-4-dehydrorhamnose reductase
MYGVIGSGQVAQHVIAELRRRNARFKVYTRSLQPDADAGVFVVYTPETIAQQLRDDDVTGVINCAALRDIGLCERTPLLAAAANVELPKIIGDVAKQVYISTDYVFDLNEEDRPLNEEAVSRGALSIYGHTKGIGEEKTLERGGVVARISSPWGVYPSPMKPSFVDMITSTKNKIDLPTDQFFSPTYLPDVAEHLVDLAGAQSRGTYHLVNQGVTNWMEFARVARQMARNKGRITGSFRFDQTRPKYGALLNTRLPRFRTWAEAMQEYISGPRAEERIKR